MSKTNWAIHRGFWSEIFSLGTLGGALAWLFDRIMSSNGNHAVNMHQPILQAHLHLSRHRLGLVDWNTRPTAGDFWNHHQSVRSLHHYGRCHSSQKNKNHAPGPRQNEATSLKFHGSLHDSLASPFCLCKRLASKWSRTFQSVPQSFQPIDLPSNPQAVRSPSALTGRGLGRPSLADGTVIRDHKEKTGTIQRRLGTGQSNT